MSNKKNILLFLINAIVLSGCANSSKIYRYDDDTNYSSLFVNRDSGAKVFVVMLDGEEYKGELIRVQDGVMIICEKYKANEKDLSDFEYPFYSLKNHNIKTIELTGENHIIGGLIFGGLGGAFSGLMMSAALAFNTSGFEGIGYAAAGLLIGAGIGMLAGGIIGGNNTTFDEVIYKYTNPDEYDFTQLNIYARYGGAEPEYLKEIK